MKTPNTRNCSSSCTVTAPDTRAVCVQYWLGKDHPDPLLTPLSLVITVARNKCKFLPPHLEDFRFLRMYCHEQSSQAPPHTVIKLHSSRQLYPPQNSNQPAACTNKRAGCLVMLIWQTFRRTKCNPCMWSTWQIRGTSVRTKGPEKAAVVTDDLRLCYLSVTNWTIHFLLAHQTHASKPLDFTFTGNLFLNQSWIISSYKVILALLFEIKQPDRFRSQQSLLLNKCQGHYPRS